MSTGRKMVTAGHVNGLHLEKNANVLSAMATDGPQPVPGRGVRVYMDDEELRGLLAHLATDARWSAAFDAALADREARIRASGGSSRILPEQLRTRTRIADTMRSFMAVRDLLRTPRSERPEGQPSQYDNDGTDRQSYEQPNCGSTAPHDPHFHSPIGGLTLNCCGVPAAPPAHRLNLPAKAPEGEREMYAALVSYGGAIVHAEAGCVTELVRPDGTVAARIVPA